MPQSRYSSSSSSSGRSGHSGSSRSSHSSSPSSREEVRSTKVALPRDRKFACVVWFAGGNPGLVKHLRRDDVTYVVESNRDGRGRRNSDNSTTYSERTKSRWHFVKRNSTDFEYDEEDDYSSRRSFRPRANPMPWGGGGGGRPGGPRRPDGASEFGGLPTGMAGQGRPGGPSGPGGFGGAGGPGAPGARGPMGGGPGGGPPRPRMPNGMPMPMPMPTGGAQRFPPGGPGGGPGFRGAMPPSAGGPSPGMRPGGGPMPRGPGGLGGPGGPGRPGAAPIIVNA